jgi:prepilin-type N-terminal cleavage/methylation domain-containing protein
MIKRQDGFTMTELLIAMTIFVFAVAAISNIFVPLLTQFKQQSRLAETQIEGAVGLDILRRDLEQAGFGLPWVIPTAITYQEGSSATVGSVPAPNTFNDSTVNPPRAIMTANNIAGLSGSDYLVIKATSVATNSSAMKWTHVTGTAAGGSSVKTWSSSIEDLNTNDRVIVLIPSRGENNQRILVNNGSAFSAQFNASAFPANFTPSTVNDIFLVYGVDPSTDLRMPFNRADYFIENVTGTTIPSRCAAGTGILMKYLISQADGNRTGSMPLLDCVADIQIIFRLDRDGDGTIESTTDVLNTLTGTPLTALELREQLKEVRVFILAHEGQKDPSYTYPNSTITLPPVSDPGAGLGRTFNFTSSGITNWQNYRWKVYTIVVKPNNLRA